MLLTMNMKKDISNTINEYLTLTNLLEKYGNLDVKNAVASDPESLGN